MKKYFFILLSLFPPIITYADEPSTTCPSGYIEINESDMTISESSCPSGYKSVGTASTCLTSNPSGSCIMYAPANTTYSDESGYFIFVEACPLE